MNSPRIGIIILAAGASTRMGTPKQLLPYQGRNFLQHTVEVAIASVCRPIILVLGAYAERIQQELSDFPVQVVENLQWNEGMSASIRVGISALNALDDKIEAVVLLVCDQPFVSAEIINQLVSAYHSTGKQIVASEYAGTLGVPALFSRRFFSELTSLREAQGAKKVIMKYPDDVFPISFFEGAIDIDTRKDYEQLMGCEIPNT
jgi:molybdenum cofactor cytidylyltransferase